MTTAETSDVGMQNGGGRRRLLQVWYDFAGQRQVC